MPRTTQQLTLPTGEQKQPLEELTLGFQNNFFKKLELFFFTCYFSYWHNDMAGAPVLGLLELQ